MNKLSDSNKIIKLSNPIILTLLGVFVAYILLKPYFNWFLMVIIVIVGLGFFYFNKVSSSAFNLFYDEDFLYLKSKSSMEKIEIKKVESIKSTSSRIKIFGFPFYKYRIEYVNDYFVKEKISFWIGSGVSEISNFTEIVNSKAQINQ